MQPVEFVKKLAALKLPNCFNPYSEICEAHDIKGADKIRRALLLELLLKATATEVDSIWIGRDLGYRGGRRTGLALTDEVHAVGYARRWGVDTRKVTVGSPCKERTASVIWDVLKGIEENIFLWNVFPLHPYEIGLPFTNRSHNSQERRIGEEVLNDLICMIKPRQLVSIGNDAVSSVKRVAPLIPSVKVRHPSYGGQTDFILQISKAYKIDVNFKQQNLF